MSLCTSLAVAVGFGIFAAHPAAAFAPVGIENFNPQWASTLTDSGNEPSSIVLSDKFDGVDQFSHLTLVASQDAVQAVWYICPPGSYGPSGGPGISVPASFPPPGSCVQIGTDTAGTVPVSPGVGVDKAFELFWDIPAIDDSTADDVVAFACDTVIAAGSHCTGQAETGIIIDDGATSTNSSSGEFLDWCVDIPPLSGTAAVCNTARHPLGHGATVPAVVPGGPFPSGSELLVRARFSDDVDSATLCIDFHADAFDPPNACGDNPAAGSESFDATTQAAPAYSSATFHVPMGTFAAPFFPANAEEGWYLFEDDDNNGGEADNADGFCGTGKPTPTGSASSQFAQDGGEGRTCILDSHYVVAAVPTPAQVHITNDDQAAFNPLDPDGTFGPIPGDQPVGGLCENVGRAKSDLVLTGFEDDVIGCIFDQFAVADAAGNKDPADLLANESATFELSGPGTIDSCEGKKPVHLATDAVQNCHLETAATLDGGGNGDKKYEMDWHATALPGGGPTAAVTITFCFDPEDNGCADAGTLKDTANKTAAAGFDHVHLRKTKNLVFHPNCHVGPVSISRKAGTVVSLTACLHDIFHNFSSLDAPLAWRVHTSTILGGGDPARFVGQPDQCFGNDCDFTLDQFLGIAPTPAGAFDGTGKAIAKVKAGKRARGKTTHVFACLDLDQNGECDATQPSIVPTYLFFALTNTEAEMEIHWKKK